MGTKLNKKGFSTVEILIVLLVVIVLALGGWLVYKNNHKTKKTTTTSTSSNMSNMNMGSNSPYAGWKTATLKYEKITFMYPSDWTLDLNEFPATPNSCTVYPGYDSATITSPDGAKVNMLTGFNCKGDAGSESKESTTISTLGQKLYLTFMFNDTFEGARIGSEFACLTKNTTANSLLALNTKNTFLDSSNKQSSPAGYCFYPSGYNPSIDPYSSTYTLTSDQIKASSDYKNAQLIFESMTY